VITSSSISNLCLHSNLPYHLLDTLKGSRALSDVRQNIIYSIAYLTFLDIAEKLRSDEHVHCCMYSFQVYYDLLLKNRNTSKIGITEDMITKILLQIFHLTHLPSWNMISSYTYGYERCVMPHCPDPVLRQRSIWFHKREVSVLVLHNLA
jgi:hypothetical protein